MDRQKILKHFVRRAKRSLAIEKMLPTIQHGILCALIFSAAILLISRLFIFPYYSNVSQGVGVGTLIITAIITWLKRVKEKEALTRLDAFYPHNELVTALSFKEEQHPLVNVLLTKAEKESVTSYELFKKREKKLWKAKSLIGILVMAIVLGVLTIFPSATQQEAVVIEKEDKIIKELKKDITKLEERTQSEQIKKQLQELANSLNKAETSEEALREVVKKQKELQLQEQQLKEKDQLAQLGGSDESKSLTAEEQKRLQELAELQNEFANNANNTQSALGKLGKPISFDLQNAIAQGSESQIDDTSSESDNNSSSNTEDQNQSNSQTGGQSQQGQGNNNGQNQGNSSSNSGQGQGNNGSSGQGQGNGGGAGQGAGNGSGTGGQGQSSGGRGAGLGQGSRDLLSIPERIGGSSETTADGGPLGEGEEVGEQKGSVPVTRGNVRPYEEVLGNYKDSYIESSDRMKLPKDLQDIVQSYFSSIEAE
ncbi:hypothetical protein JOD29_003768 [Lysinibacillus composti]|uniref:Cdk activating kinase (CAK)/RNA polymerase II transcription initiation/nucleotide excision repair factor TFIIH/TFIIK, cyclin H subunit n=1 Tax=Lysinibacillus composti TaxID=720633 RepID=A0A3N9U6K9_9BACI|nr:hypothetical protein [Lysinibacillus composti]MBM7610486.1 hypothetical protein [Lysinibacillus composti]RQW72283.1 hypothetical protein EBB45_18515 [Lysinibacillus composti]